MTLEPDFEDFISLLNQYQVEYLVVGGYAMAFHGKPRYTGDLDIWINISEINAKRASLMKSNFYKYYDALKTKDEKIFFKMGSNHLARGMNLITKVYDIGNAVFEIAEHNKTNFTNVYCMVRYTTDKGKIIDDFESDDNENPKVFSKLYDKEKWVLVDIRSLRPRIKYDGSLTLDTYRLIEKYDFVLVSSEVMQ